MKRAVAAVNGLIGLVVAIPLVRFVFDPLRRTRSGGKFLRVAPLTALTAGRPTRFAVSGANITRTKRDAIAIPAIWKAFVKSMI